MRLYIVTAHFLLNQNPSKPQLLVAHCLSIMFHAVMHSFSMRYWRFAVQRLHWNTLQRVEMLLYQRLMTCFGQGDWLPGCLGSSISDSVSQWEENLGLMNNSALSGAATTAVCLPLPIFPSLICLLITSFFALLCLCLTCLPFGLSFLSFYCCCVTVKMLASGGNRWVVAADVCNPGNRSLTCFGIKPDSLLCHLRHKNTVIPVSILLISLSLSSSVNHSQYFICYETG